MTSDGTDFTLKIALMKLCTRGAVFGAHIVINLILVILMSSLAGSSAPASNAGTCVDNKDT